VLAVLGAVASFFSLSSTVPQIARAARHRSAEGVSWSSLLMNLSSCVLWAVYGAAAVDQVLLATNLLAIGLLVVLAVVLLAAEGENCWWALALTAAGSVVGFLAAVAAAFDPFPIALVAMVITGTRMWPQARLAVAGVPLWGLDPWATALGWMGWLLWSVYGVAAGDTAVGVCSIAGLLLHSVVCAFRLPPRRTLHSIASGRLGPVVAQVASPVSVRFPFRADDYSLVA
jgi:MtN3 and saliva related transmembrane protein